MTTQNGRGGKGDIWKKRSSRQVKSSTESIIASPKAGELEKATGTG
jgi:hypothetical protein